MLPRYCSLRARQHAAPAFLTNIARQLHNMSKKWYTETRLNKRR